jgi:hypothetical protein
MAGCGSAQQTQSPTRVEDTTTTAAAGAPKTDLREFAQIYLRITDPANAAADRFEKNRAAYTDETTVAEIAADVKPLAEEYEKADNALLRVSWPPTVAADIKALVAANVPLISDMTSLGDQDALALSTWSNQVRQDIAKAHAAAMIVRADLGLPPP